MMTWLLSDMTASTKTWKLVMLHRPPYNGNPESGNGRVMKYLPQLVDEAGIDLVISGHDHMYSRSLPLLAGQPNPAGATYLIAGSDSAKYYDNNGSGIARFADVLFDDNVNTYTTLQIRGGELQRADPHAERHRGRRHRADAARGTLEENEREIAYPYDALAACLAVLSGCSDDDDNNSNAAPRTRSATKIALPRCREKW